MDGSMDELVSGWMDGLMSRWMDEQWLAGWLGG